MYCIECGQPIPDTAKFCAACGQQTTRALRKLVLRTEPSEAASVSSVTQAGVYGGESRLNMGIVAAVIVCAGMVVSAGYGLMRVGVIPGHRPGNTLSQDAASWDPFTHDEVATAIRAFDAKIDNEERTAKTMAVEKSRYDPKH
jgi:hypothetical protein